MLRILALSLCLAAPSAACETALVLAVDISGSIDEAEYAIQMQGMAFALSDPNVVEVLVRGQVALGVVHWSGSGRQVMAMPWQRMLSPGAVARFAATARDLPRAFTASDTAVGEALAFSAAQFAAVPDCARRVIDISGDGPENAGFTAAGARAQAVAQGIEINALAIEDPGISTPVTTFYRRLVISPRGFVMTARSIHAYPETLRQKLLRELSRPVS